MEIEDIEVGKRYRCLLTPATDIWLGVGRRKLFTENEFVEKHLVLIESENKDAIGRMMQEGDDAREGWWDHIVEEDSGLYMFVKEN